MEPITKEKKFNIRERIFDFVLRILEISEMLSEATEDEIFRKQLIRAGTSIGANMEEGDGTDTKKDFIYKAVLARKEAKETKYWLRLISIKYNKKDEFNADINEAQEIINILSAIISNTKNS
jgi:four helix bundle protein